MTVIKICGITELDDALCALENGVDLMGFVFAPSRRQIRREKASGILERCRLRSDPLRMPWQAVGVFANQPLSLVQDTAAEVGLDIVQLSGDESPEYCRLLRLPLYKTVHVADLLRASSLLPGEDMRASLLRLRKLYRADRLLLDSGGAGRWGGTGTAFNWTAFAAMTQDCLVAGGLDPMNVVEAMEIMEPWGVDVSSGVEINGRKDPDLIRQFISMVRRKDHGNYVD